MSRDDRSYYEGRAEVELKRAQESNDPIAVRAHYLLAELHLERAGQCLDDSGVPGRSENAAP